MFPSKVQTYTLPFLYVTTLITILTIGLFFISPKNYSVAAQYQQPILLFLFTLSFGALYLLAIPIYKSFLNSPSPQVIFSLKRILLVSGFVFLFVSLFFSLLYSQDLYWHFSYIDAWTTSGLDPYTTTINEMSGNEWTDRVTSWRDTTTHLGPLWSLFLAIFSSLSLPIWQTLILIRLVFAAIIALSGWLLNLVMKNEGFGDNKRLALVFLFISNPLLLLHGLIDLHSDVLLIPFLISAYYFIQKKSYALSAIMLVIGASIKYVPGLLIFVPIILSLREIGFKKTIKSFLPVALIAIALLGFSILIFGKSIIFPPGLTFYINYSKILQSLGGSALITLILTYFLHLTTFQIGVILKLFSVLLITVLSGIFAYQRSPLQAFVWPFIITLFFFVPWFFPWYFLWVLPFFILLVPIRIVVFGSVLALLTVGSGWGIIVSPIFIATMLIWILNRKKNILVEKHEP